MLRVYMAVHDHDGLEEVTTLDQLKLNYATLVNCDPARDMVLAEVDGELVAYARVFWNDLVDGGRSYENFGFVDPAWRRRGIGAALHRRNEARLREIAAEHPDVAPKWLGSEGIDADQGNTALLLGDGYTAARFFYDMVAPSLDGIVEPADARRDRAAAGDPGAVPHQRVADSRGLSRRLGQRRIDRGGLGPLRGDRQRRSQPRRIALGRCRRGAGAVLHDRPGSHARRRSRPAGRARRRSHACSAPYGRGLAPSSCSRPTSCRSRSGLRSAAWTDTDSPERRDRAFGRLGFAPEKTFTPTAGRCVSAHGHWPSQRAASTRSRVS